MRRALLLFVLAVTGACGGSTSPDTGSAPVLPALFVRSVSGQGVLDIAAASTYAPAIVVGNRAEGDGARCTITGFDVTVANVAGNAMATFHSDAAAIVDGAHAGTPSYAEVTATLLDAATTAGARAQLSNKASAERVIAFVSATGTSTTGVAVKSLPAQVPVDVCNGCLTSP